MNTSKHLSIKAWAEDDRPREKMLRQGRSSLSNAELVGILIGSGNTEETAVDLGKRMLAEVDNDLAKLGKLSITELCRFKGIGTARAITIAAAIELGLRRQSQPTTGKLKITGSRDVFRLFSPLLADVNHEEFWMLMLDKAGTMISKCRISQGFADHTQASIRSCIKLALENNAASVIAVHNHPSGQPTPSKEDEALTEKLQFAFKFFNITLSDHIIMSNARYFSFADENLVINT